MSDGGGDAPRGPAPDEETFVRAIEERFRRLRGRPLLLSPDDFERALGWRREGIPLHVVLETLEDVFRKANAGRPRRRPLTLAYCEPAVREALESLREQRLGAARAFETGPSRRELIGQALAALERSNAPARARDQAAAGLRSLLDESVVHPAEDPIPGIADQLIAACLASLDERARADLEAEARSSLARYAAEMSPPVRERAFSIALARGVRRRFSLPDLTLVPPF